MIRVKSVWAKLAVFVLGIVTTLCASTPALAQSLVQPPAVSSVDGNGVNLANGKYNLPDLDIGIGASGSGLSRITQEGSDTWTGTATYTAPPPGFEGMFTYNFSFNGTQFRFVPIWNSGTSSWTPGPYSVLSGGPERLTCAGNDYSPTNATGTCTITLGDGTVLTYDKSIKSSAYSLALTTIAKPDGETISLTYYLSSGLKAIKSVSSSLGWMLKYEVNGDYVVTKVTGINTGATYCDPNASSCSVASSYPTVTKTISGTTPTTTTIARNGVTLVSYTVNGDTMTITSPSGVTKTVTVFPSGNTYAGRVSQLSVGGSTWSYSYAAVGADAETTVTNPNGKTRKLVVSSLLQKIASQTDEAGRVTTYAYDSTPGSLSFGRLTKIVNPDGNALTGGYTAYEYNAAGDVTKTIVMPKSGTTNGNNASAAAMVTIAGYGNACNGSNGHYCHKPTYVTDANGVTTDYVYDTTHGGLKHIYGTVINNVQPETRYTYAQFTPYIKNAAGNPVAQPQVWRLIQTRACMSAHQNTCYGGTDERVSITGYSGNNVLPTSSTVERGNGTLSQTATVEYNDNGQVKSATGPKGGVYNQAFSFYDDLGRVKGTIGIDPDSGGSRLRQATRTSYDTSGRVWKVEAGTVNGTTENDVMNNLSVLTTDTNEFSSTTGLAIVAKHYEGATLTALTQKSYDNLFRTDCVAQRLNPAVFGTVTSTSACSLGTTNADGTRDRITKYNYHAVMPILVSTISGYGTLSQATDFTNIYDYSSTTSSGNQVQVVDGKANVTTYYYDNFNRPVATCYAQAGNGAAVNTGDCQSVAYRTASLTGVSQAGTLPASTTLRDNQTITLNYDLAGRLSSKTLNGTTIESITYNNFNQTLTHTQNNVTGTYSYNALGWLLSDAQPMGTISYGYDAYGRRSSMAYPGGFSVVYDYNNDDGVANLYQYQNGLSALIGFTYNNSTGTRDLLWRVNGQHTNYSFGNQAGTAGTNNIGPNLVGMTQGSANTLSFTYNAADQIKSRANSNTSFNFNPAPVSTAYVNDGLNRISTVNGSGLGYDGRGNLNADGGNSYTYNINNLLTSATQSGVTSTLTYDAENRLLSITKNGATTKFLYDGSDLIAEYDVATGNVLRRYIHGPGTDEPLVMYDNVYVNNLGTRYFLHADQQGTITHVTNDNGSLNTVYAFDAYGLRQTVSGSLSSRFSYTGQTWLPEIGMYYYKARLYNPAIGRFMQTDPIGYGDGMNWYAYVGNDPVNMSDPSGTEEDCRSGELCKPKEVTSVGDCWADKECRQHRIDRGHRMDAIAYNNLLYAGCGGSVACQKERFGYEYGFNLEENQWMVHAVMIAWQAPTIVADGFAVVGSFSLKAVSEEVLAFCAKCLVAGTEVATPNGLVPIEKIKLGDLVLAYDETTGQIKAEPVTALIRPNPKVTFAVKLIDGDHKTETFRASADHPWLLKPGQWASTEELKAGDHLKTATGIDLVVTSVKPTGKTEAIYNLTVDGLHTYLIGKSHVVVHNTCNLHGGLTTVRNALSKAEQWLGKGYKEIRSGIFRSADGTRQFRMTNADITGAHGNGGAHVHFESIGSDGKTIVENSHVYLSNP